MASINNLLFALETDNVKIAIRNNGLCEEYYCGEGFHFVSLCMNGIFGKKLLSSKIVKMKVDKNGVGRATVVFYIDFCEKPDNNNKNHAWLKIDDVLDLIEDDTVDFEGQGIGIKFVTIEGGDELRLMDYGSGYKNLLSNDFLMTNVASIESDENDLIIRYQNLW